MDSPCPFARQPPQIGDDIRPIRRVVQPKGHVVIGYDTLGIGEPPVERSFIPRDGRVLNRVRIGELRVFSRIAAVYAAQGRPDLDLVERIHKGRGLDGSDNMNCRFGEKQPKPVSHLSHRATMPEGL